MKKVLGSVIALALLLVPMSAIAAIKAGDICKKVGATATANGKRYTCVKNGKKIVWNKGVAVVASKPVMPPLPTPTTSSPTASSTLEIDPSRSVEGTACSPTKDSDDRVGYSTDLKRLVVLHCLKEGRYFDLGQLYPITVNQKNGEVESGTIYIQDSKKYTFRYVPTTEASDGPTTKNVMTIGNIPVSQCKIKQPNPQGLHRGFNFSGQLGLKNNAIIQIIPLQASDALSTGNPSNDYKEFLSETKDFLHNLSEGRWNISYPSPEKYLMLPNSLSSYKVGSNETIGEARTAGQEAIIKAGLALIGSNNPNSADMVMFVVPPDTSEKLFARFSNTFQIPFGSSSVTKAYSIIKSDPAWGTVHHDFFHLGLGIPDHYGEEKYNGRDSTQLLGSNGEIFGTDRWGNMSGTKMDWLGWDKWLAGLMIDTQVICAKVESATNYLLKPSAVFGVTNKLLIIPTGEYTGIAIESMRQVGYNTQLSKSLSGALVYSIDLTNNVFGGGFNVFRPINRLNMPSAYPGPGDTALRVGDFVSVNGYRISVIEAGNFGDVVRVEKD
jgi:M6 family metalloprotease-like protein